jgi:hypothetical protein
VVAFANTARVIKPAVDKGGGLMAAEDQNMWGTPQESNMNEPAQNYTPREFVDKLQRDDFSRALEITGLIKDVEDDEQHLLFAWGTYCDTRSESPLLDGYLSLLCPQ